MKRDDRQCLDPPGMRFAGMSQGLACGDLIHVSGQVALKNGRITGIGDPEVQARQCFANIAAVLALADASVDDVVALRCYLVHRDHYPAYAAVKNEIFTTYPPCGTAVIVQGLLLPDLLLEVEAVAQRRQTA
ncbi:RidA family protein [Corticibacterium sp. UT-5YL-CI-8]|nr:RidA family protein [Tianweitania sp. UT-5YL-CI-8]